MTTPEYVPRKTVLEERDAKGLIKKNIFAVLIYKIVIHVNFIP